MFLLETEKRTFSKHVLNTQIIRENDFYEHSEYGISGFLFWKTLLVF